MVAVTPNVHLPLEGREYLLFKFERFTMIMVHRRRLLRIDAM